MLDITVDEIRKANYNTSCECRLLAEPCKMLIEKGAEYKFIVESKHKYMIHLECELRFTAELLEIKSV